MDLFSRDVATLGGVFTADRAKLTLPENLGVLVQSMNVGYTQTINRLYEIGSPYIYYVGGRTQGQLNVNRVIGPKGTIAAMYVRFGDVCRAKTNVINLELTETDCSADGGGAFRTTYTMKNCVITQVGLSVEAQAMIINESTAMMFSSLETSGPGAPSALAA